MNTATQNKPKSPSQSQEAIPSFIRKTYDILEEAKYPQYIDWTPDGAALVIKKPAEFAQKVLPAYFKHSNLTSFVRQLNMYNFHKRRTLDVGHVYFHELFQKGKRHLLKEIKRKSSDQQPTEKAPKGQDPLDLSPQAGSNLSTLAYENQCIKQLYNEALTKISLFEEQLKQLTAQNQTLWAQIRQQKSATEKKKELTQDQLPMTLGGTPIPILNFSTLNYFTQPKAQVPNEHSAPVTKVTLSMGNINSFQNHNKESGSSTDASQNSPAVQSGQGNEESLNVSASTTNMPQETPSQPPQALFNPYAVNTPYLNNPFATQLYNPASGLGIRKDLSVSQLFEAWTSEGQTPDMFYFGDHKRENTENRDKFIANMFQDTSVLGKRQNELEVQGFRGIEPTPKRHELSVFSRKRMTSTATEENEGNVDMDLMDFRF